MRLFFALWPSQGVRAQFHDWARMAHADCGGRVLRADTLHLTLVFLGEVDPARLGTLLTLMQRTPITPGTLTFDQIGFWSDRKIVWASAAHVPDSLHATRDALLSQWQAAGGHIEAQGFRPHVTLLRHARCAPADPNPRPLLWTYDTFSLIQSIRTPRGPHYRRLAPTLDEPPGTDNPERTKSPAPTRQYGIVR
ncbi:RNA 2',3'-cyclic phosphodiesterase [Pandoraea terrae]|uniref:RNA 2',3'-cyclic phosphodiesterase n=1 Tax=Pandoraea terrae TaxID=1537710 RepID=A0A5E4VYF1_9BURK|nr:RNA 2',3'-cyclic phosphodiesterase [Pandoraea terrae]VVE17448.1 RNA 2',3'-cyclic phosphodiesterase [Pandoraea terrae]